MFDRRPRSPLSDQRGIALPLALVVLTLLTSLTLAFLALTSTEPTIAANLQRVARAKRHISADAPNRAGALTHAGHRTRFALVRECTK